MIKVLVGDIFESGAQTLVNTVNTVGVMGKGVALGFRKHFSDMYEDYVRRCERHQVHLGEPYLYRRVTPPHIINFPTKEHWRSVSRLDDIVRGLRYLRTHIVSGEFRHSPFLRLDVARASSNGGSLVRRYIATCLNLGSRLTCMLRLELLRESSRLNSWVTRCPPNGFSKRVIRCCPFASSQHGSRW